MIPSSRFSFSVRTLSHSTHSYEPDERNDRILINIDGELFPRDEARVSVFDSGFLLGDGVWEGLRLHQGTLVFLERHLDRLFAGAKAIGFHPGLEKAALEKRLHETLAANEMDDGVHVRLIVSRGVRSTPYQDPRVVVGDPTIVIIPEHKRPASALAIDGIRVGSVAVRRGYPDVQDPTLNTLSKLNCITACILATRAGYDEGLMLDPHGFVATCNSTHFFIVRDGVVMTSTGQYCLDGITRQVVLELCAASGIESREDSFTLADAYNADEAFVTGTFAGLVPVAEIDGRDISAGRGPVVAQLQDAYMEMIQAEVARQ